MTKWKLLALDIDGTTIVRGESLSDRNRESILRAQNQGLYITFATGRHRNGMVSDTVKDLGIKVPFVTLNGGEVWTPEGQMLSRRTLPPEELQFLYSLAGKYNIRCWGSTTEKPVNQDTFEWPLEKRSWVKFGYYTEDVEALAKVWGELEARGKFSLSNSDPYNIEVNAVGANKATGLETVVRYIGIQSAEVAAMGDSLNDIPMFEWAGLSVAMGNAQEPVKKVAQHITLTCEEDAVSHMIEQILSEQL